MGNPWNNLRDLIIETGKNIRVSPDEILKALNVVDRLERDWNNVRREIKEKYGFEPSDDLVEGIFRIRKDHYNLIDGAFLSTSPDVQISDILSGAFPKASMRVPKSSLEYVARNLDDILYSRDRNLLEKLIEDVITLKGILKKYLKKNRKDKEAARIYGLIEEILTKYEISSKLPKPEEDLLGAYLSLTRPSRAYIIEAAMNDVKELIKEYSKRLKPSIFSRIKGFFRKLFAY